MLVVSTVIGQSENFGFRIVLIYDMCNFRKTKMREDLNDLVLFVINDNEFNCF